MLANVFLEPVKAVKPRSLALILPFVYLSTGAG